MPLVFNIAGIFQQEGSYQSFTLQSVSGTSKCALGSVNQALESPEPWTAIKVLSDLIRHTL